MRGRSALLAAAILTAATGAGRAFPYLAPRHSATKHGYPTDADFAAMEKAQIKRDKRAAKRLAATGSAS